MNMQKLVRLRRSNARSSAKSKAASSVRLTL